jgi:hypothetical protein
MKNLLFLFGILALLLQEAAAQMHITTNYQRNYQYDAEAEDFILIGEDSESVTFFEFNEGMTMFKHTTPTMTSSYIINSTKKDEENETWEFAITSDVGNKYMMILNPTEKKLSFLVKKDDGIIVIQHSIKKLWVDE